MFSFPNKERKLAWIRSVVTPGFSSQSNPATGIPLYHAGIKQGASGSNDPLMGSVDNVFMGVANTRRFSRENIDPEISVVSLQDPGPIPSTSRGVQWFDSGSESSASLSAANQVEENEALRRCNSTDSVNLINFTGGAQDSGVHGRLGAPTVRVGDGLPSVNEGVVLGGILARNLVLLDGEQTGHPNQGIGQAGESRSENEEQDEGRQVAGSENEVETRPSSTTLPIVERSGQHVIDMTGIEDAGESEGPSVYLKTYYNMMHYFGVCWYNPMDSLKVRNWCWKAFKLLLKVVFPCLAVLSTFQSLCQVKHGFLKSVFEGGYSTFSEFGFSMAFLFAKVYGVYLFTWQKKKTETMLAAIVEYERKWHTTKFPSVKSWKRKLVVALAVSTVAYAGTRTVFGTGDVENLIQDSSHELSVDIFIWHAKHMNETAVKLEAKYGRDVTPTTVAFCAIVLARDFASYTQVGMIYDVIVLVGIVLMIFVKSFMTEVRAVTDNVPVENAEEWNLLQARREKVWKQFMDLKKTNDAINDVFDPLLKLLHGGNLLMYAFFMALIVFWEFPLFALSLFAINMIKAEISYFIAGKIAEHNDDIRTWVCNWALHTGTITVDGVVMHVTVILKQLSKNPIGLGKGKFLIHQTFHYKLVGLVGTVFFSMADEENNS